MRFLPLGVLVLALLPCAGAAQQLGEGAGSPRPFSLETSVTTGSEYTDNFFRQQSHAQSNFRETITPDLALVLTGPFHQGRLRYHPTGAHSSVLDKFQYFHAADASAAYEATPFFSVRARDEFLESDSPGTVDPNTRLSKRVTSTRNTAALELPYLTETWSITPRGTWLATANESDTPETDERSRILTLGADSSVTLLPLNTTVRASGESTRARFRLGGDFTGQTYRGSVSRPFGPRFDLTLDGSLNLRQPDRSESFMLRDAAIGARYEWSETTSLSGRVGYQQTDVTTQPGRQGPTYSTQATYTGALLTLVTTSEMSFQETFTEAQNVGVVRTQSFGATLTHQATEDLQVKGFGRWSVNESLQSTTQTPSATGLPSETEQKDTVMTWGLSTTYQVTRRVKLAGFWEHTQRESTTAQNSFAADTFRLELTVDFR